MMTLWYRRKHSVDIDDYVVCVRVRFEYVCVWDLLCVKSVKYGEQKHICMTLVTLRSFAGRIGSE